MSNISLNAILFGSGGSRELIQEELNILCDGDTLTDSFVLNAGENVVIEIDLGIRYILDRVVYYYSGGVVSIQGSESLGLWYDLPISYGSGFCSINTSSYNVRWVKITHECVIGLSYGREVLVYSNGNNILFGNSGTFSSYGMDTSGLVVQPVSIYNSTASIKDVYVFIEEDDTGASDSLAYSLSSSGVFYLIRSSGIDIPNDYSWDSGSFVGLFFDGEGLTLSGVLTSGTYYSSVIDLRSVENCRFFYTSYEPGGSSVGYFDSGVQSGCCGIRSFYIPPSGSWVSGVLAEDYDYYWSISQGVLDFAPIKKDDIMDLVPGGYVQFAITITGSLIDKPYVYSIGVEEPLVVKSVPSFSSSDIYITTISGTSSGKTTNLLCWSRE